MATNGVKSNMPTLGMMRRKGARSGSVIRNKMMASMFVGLGENQDIIARAIISKVNTSHNTMIKLNKNATALTP